MGSKQQNKVLILHLPLESMGDDEPYQPIYVLKVGNEKQLKIFLKGYKQSLAKVNKELALFEKEFPPLTPESEAALEKKHDALCAKYKVLLAIPSEQCHFSIDKIEY
jgi:hypothetical protein